MADVVHGSHQGTDYHTREREPFCLPCADWNADYQRSRRVLRSKCHRLNLPAAALAELFSGAPVDEVLSRQFGPLTMAALRQLSTKAGDHRG